MSVLRIMREREYGLILLLQEGRESKHAGGERHWRHKPARADRRLHQPPTRDPPGAPHAHEATRTSRMHSTAEQDTSERPALVRPHAHTRSNAYVADAKHSLQSIRLQRPVACSHTHTHGAPRMSRMHCTACGGTRPQRPVCARVAGSVMARAQHRIWSCDVPRRCDERDLRADGEVSDGCKRLLDMDMARHTFRQ